MIKLVLPFLLFPTFIFGQIVNTTDKNGRGKIYNDAIKHYIMFTSKNDKSIFDTLFILKNELVTNSLQSIIQKRKIVLIDSPEMSNRLQGDNSFIAHKIYPLSVDNGYFYISIVPFHVYKDKDEIALANTGTCIISYTYDDATKSFKFYKSTSNVF